MNETLDQNSHPNPPESWYNARIYTQGEATTKYRKRGVPSRSLITVYQHVIILDKLSLLACTLA
jgi:hypothetical protein